MGRTVIGPKRPGDTVYSIADWGDATVVSPHFKVINLSDGATVIARTTAGIIHLQDGGYRAAFPLAAAGSYAVEWDDNGGTVFYDEEIWVEDVVLIDGGSILGPGDILPPYTDANPLRMKRGDTKPALNLQLLATSGSPYPLQVSDIVYFTIQPQIALDGGFAGAPLLHKQMTITDAPNGRVSYQWLAGDLSFYGSFLIEVEVNTVGGDVISFPRAGATPQYIPLVIAPDEDPGLTP